MNRKIRSYICILIIISFLFIFSGCGENFDPSSYSISGKVTCTGGGGIEGVNILFSGDFSGKATTGKDGSWQASRLKGTVTVTPSMSGCTFDQASRTVTQRANDVNFIVTGFTDDFTDAGSGWAVGNESEYNFAYDSGEYSMTVKKPVTLFLSSAPVPVSAKYSIQADMHLAPNSPNAKLGLFFYGGSDFIYGFRIDPGRQQYQFFKLTAGNTFTDPNGFSWTFYSNISTTGTNQLLVKQDNNKVTLSINGDAVIQDSPIDAHIGNSGSYEVGLLVGSFDNTTDVPTTGHFDNFILSSEVLSGSVIGKSLSYERMPVKVRVFREE